MNQSTFVPGLFHHTVHFNLARTVGGAMRSGIIALIHHFGDIHDNHLRIAAVMQAFRRSVGRGGNQQFDSSIRDLPLHNSPIAQSFIDGIQHVPNRFGDTAETRYAILQMFQELTAEFEKNGHTALPFNWDKDDDPDGPIPEDSVTDAWYKLG